MVAPQEAIALQAVLRSLRARRTGIATAAPTISRSAIGLDELLALASGERTKAQPDALSSRQSPLAGFELILKRRIRVRNPNGVEQLGDGALLGAYRRPSEWGKTDGVHLKLLIDGIVRQTTVLIAQLSTASGVRAPLSHVADQVFLTLAREIESQGVRKQVVADMFGLAMRSYQKKMRRLTESGTMPERSLWEAVLDFVGHESPTRSRVLERFSYDGERDVVAVLNDLVRSGLVYTTGAGEGTVFGVTSTEVQNPGPTAFHWLRYHRRAQRTAVFQRSRKCCSLRHRTLRLSALQDHRALRFLARGGGPMTFDTFSS